MPVGRKLFNLITGQFPAFSGTTGQILLHMGGGVQTASGKDVGEENALRVAAIWIANTILADEIASLKLKIVKRDDTSRSPVQPSSLRALWGDPNPDQTLFGFDASETLSLTLYGASYSMLGWTNGGDLDSRWPINPEHVSLKRLEDGGIKLESAGQGELLNRKGRRPEFSFVPLYTLPGRLTPVSPVRMAAELAGLSLAYEETASKLVGHGMSPSAVLTFDEWMDTDKLKEVTGELQRIHGGSGRAGGIAAVGGPKPQLHRMGMSMVDAEFVAQNERVFKILLAMWRIPPTVAGMVDKPSTWGTGIAEFSRGLERFTMRPLVERRQSGHEKYITRWVSGGEDLQARYIFDSLLSATPKERTEIQRQRLMAGLTSVQRVLAQNDEPPFEDDETVFSQLSMSNDEERESRIRGIQVDSIVKLMGAGLTWAEAWTVFGGPPDEAPIQVAGELEDEDESLPPPIEPNDEEPDTEE